MGGYAIISQSRKSKRKHQTYCSAVVPLPLHNKEGWIVEKDDEGQGRARVKEVNEKQQIPSPFFGIGSSFAV